MTCVVGLVDNGDVWIGADSAAVSGWHVAPTADPKVGSRRGVLIGYTSSFRFGQLLLHSLQVPDLPPYSKSDPAVLTCWLVGPFIDSVREVLAEKGWKKRKDEREEGGTCLLGLQGRLFKLADDLGVTESRRGFDACGAGEQFALGALAAIPLSYEPAERVRLALAAAATNCAAVRDPFVIQRMPAWRTTPEPAT